MDYHMGAQQDENTLRVWFREAGQGHVFNGFDEMTEMQKQSLLEQCNSFDVHQVNQIY